MNFNLFDMLSKFFQNNQNNGAYSNDQTYNATQNNLGYPDVFFTNTAKAQNINNHNQATNFDVSPTPSHGGIGNILGNISPDLIKNILPLFLSKNNVGQNKNIDDLLNMHTLSNILSFLKPKKNKKAEESAPAEEEQTLDLSDYTEEA